MRGLYILLSFLVLYQQPNYAQFWHIDQGKKHVVIPFDFVNNLIVLSVELNDEPLSFILDNGVKETLLFGEVDSLRLKNTSAFIFRGFGIGEPIKGLMSRNNTLRIGGATDSIHHLYVVTDTAFNLSKNIGIHIHGILGSSFFRNNVIAIDYIKKRLILAPKVEYLGVKLSKYKSYPIEIENDRAYQMVNIETAHNSYYNKKVLLDLGNSDPMLLFENEIDDYRILSPFIRDYLGYGFNGAVYGLKNRIKSLYMGDFAVKQPIVSYPDSNSYDRNRIAENRVGSIGNQILSRFYLILDYPNNRFYLRTNKNFNKPYTLDMSGLEVVHEGFEFVKHRFTNFTKKGEDGSITINFSTEVNYKIELHANYIIDQVRPNSPAERIGVMVGDKLLRINGRNVGKMKLQDIKNKLQAGQDKLVRLRVMRNDQELDLKFKLEDPLSITIE